MSNYPREVQEQAARILAVLSEHRRMPEEEKTASGEFSDEVYNTVQAMVAAGKPVRLVMPSFPTKSAVRGKTLGNTPDMAELFSLKHLNQICENINAVYPAGATMILYTDRFAFDGILPVELYSKEKCADYLPKLRTMLKKNNLSNLEIIDLDGQVDLTEYAENEADFHHRIQNPATPSDHNSLILYLGQKRFMETELAMAYPERSSSQRKKEAKKNCTRDFPDERRPESISVRH